jgi:hypothetical protein
VYCPLLCSEEGKLYWPDRMKTQSLQKIKSLSGNGKDDNLWYYLFINQLPIYMLNALMYSLIELNITLWDRHYDFLHFNKWQNWAKRH